MLSNTERRNTTPSFDTSHPDRPKELHIRRRHHDRRPSRPVGLGPRTRRHRAGRSDITLTGGRTAYTKSLVLLDKIFEAGPEAALLGGVGVVLILVFVLCLHFDVLSPA